MNRIERETSITFNEAEDDAIVCTFIQRVIRRIEKMGFTAYRKTPFGRWFYIPKGYISIRKKRVLKLSEQQRDAIGKRLSKAK
jgi:hypothetical protein